MPAVVLAPAAAAVGNRGGLASTSTAVHGHAPPRFAPRVTPARLAPARMPGTPSISIPRAAAGKIEINKAPPQPITLTEGALDHLKKLRVERGEDVAVLRVGVKSGGCSGMSYVMDFAKGPEDKRPDDTVLSFADGEIEIRIDPKSLLYLFGLQLDYSSELIGGGYKFSNPNAAASCGCGTSFSV